MKNRGFTLVELLVVVGIMAVLSVIGISIYGGAQTNARDARRRADIEQIANAYEINYDAENNQYASLAGSQFAGGQIPKDPKNNVGYTCVKGPDAGCETQDSIAFRICASLEGGTTYCREASQGGGSIAVAPPPSASPRPPPVSCPSSGLAAYWKMDEASGTSIADSVGSNTATVTGAAVVAGKISNSRDFSGSSQYATIGAFSIGGADPNKITVSVWIQDDDFASATRRTIFSSTNTNTAGAVSIEKAGSTGAGAIVIIIPTIFLVSTNPGVITDSNWHNIVYVRRGSGATHEIWVDGVQKSLSINGTNDFIDTGNAKNIGIRSTPSGQPWDGRIDEVGVWSRALSSAEITTLYNGGIGITCP